MRRGTTPDYILTIPGYDLSECAVYVTIAQSGAKVTLSGDRLDITAEAPDEETGAAGETRVAFRLTQEETLGLRAGRASVQARWIDERGTALATEIGMIDIMPVLLEEVIEHGGTGAED